METCPHTTDAVSSTTTASTADTVSKSNINNDDNNNDGKSNMNNNSINKKKAVRHAEKRRTATCQFSNRIAAVSVQHYRQHVSRMFQQMQKQTCLATIVAHERVDSIPAGSVNVDQDDDAITLRATDRLTVVGMGVGTKFLSESVLQENQKRNMNKVEEEEEEEEEESYGSRVRDCHAEVLARRAFRCHLSLEMKRLVQEQMQQREPEPQDPVDSILECVVVRSSTSTTTPPRLAFRLRPGVTLHLYTSSAPCGNACLKKFATMQAEVFREDLCSTEWPTVDKCTHEYTPGHSLPLGQFSLLVKKDSSVESMSSYEDYQHQHNSSSSNNNNHNHNKKRGRVEENVAIAASTTTTTTTTTADSTVAAAVVASTTTATTTGAATAASDRTTGSNNATSHPTQTKKPGKKSKSPAHWPSNVSDTWCPPGTTTVWSGRGSLHTCSDKICRWNCLGLQGSLLAALMVVDLDPDPDQQNNQSQPPQPMPLYLSTVTVGRKLTAVTCRRAICCRVGPTDHDTAKRNGSSSSILPGPYLKLHHPTVMGTSVYMDDTGVIDMSSHSSDTTTKGKGQQQTTGQDVRFHSTLSWAWWPALSVTNSGQEAECIDGATGWAILPRRLESEHDDDDDDAADTDITNVYDDSNRTTRSRVSTASLLELYMQIDQAIQQWTLAASSSNEASAMEMEVDTKMVPRTLAELRSLKKHVSRPYEDAKEQLLTKHPVLRQWKRRENYHSAG
jgi:hypothetical protein